MSTIRGKGMKPELAVRIRMLGTYNAGVMSPQEFLELACQLAYEQGRGKDIDDDEFLPQIKAKGATDGEIAGIKRHLEHAGKIKNRYFFEEFHDFRIGDHVFVDFLKRTLPPDKLRETRKMSQERHGALSTAMLRDHLGVSDNVAKYLLHVVQYEP